jgi:hypothetical protein
MVLNSDQIMVIEKILKMDYCNIFYIMFFGGYM